MMKSPEEVEQLKREWCAAPEWELETTEGFEEYRDELLSFQISQRQKWLAESHIKRCQDKSRMGLAWGDDLIDVETLFNYLTELARRVDRLEQENERLQQEVHNLTQSLKKTNDKAVEAWLQTTRF
jgi:hypothetical protein